jgi:RNA polymerase sigma-70 factor (ECF subfamily)
VDLRAALDMVSASVFRVARRMGVTDAEADDAMQRVFIRLARHWETLRALPPDELRAYASTVAAHVAIDIANERLREAKLARLNEPEEIEAPESLPDEVLERKCEHEILDAILRTLPEERRTVFVLYEIEELEMRQIAERLGLPMGTVASRLRKAREEFERAAARMRAAQRWKGERR